MRGASHLEGRAGRPEHCLARRRHQGDTVRFGLFYEHQLPRPWDAQDEHRLIQDALDEIELADRLGFHCVWEVEHHFLEEYSHSSAPEVFLAAASQRTKQIRLAHGIMLTAPAYNHPARVAERISMLDLVSGGRVEFGSGESGSATELGGFGIDPATKREQWREGLQVAIRCMTETPFGGHEGTYVSMPPRNVVPKPHQKPHPPLCLAAREGIGALAFTFVDPEEAAHWVADYERLIEEECVPIGHAVNPRIACVTPMACHHDAETALRMGLEGANFFGFSLAHYYIFGEHVPGGTVVWDEFQEKRDAMGYSADIAVALEREVLGAKIIAGEIEALRGAIGTPDQIREFLRRYEQAGVDQVIFAMQNGRTRHEDIMSSLELFGREVLPEFAERADDFDKRKAERLAPALEAAMARRPDDAPTMPDGYVVTALPKQTLGTSGEALFEKVAASTATGDSSVLAELAKDPDSNAY
jgi:alkanesulfonate monooxygenase SsuD/methylene tetrahydromethanopterin reductase-like flavin-dependent oxidoreductase (luciferase family)